MTNVCVLGKTVVDTLFEAEDPIGKTIRLQNQPFRVIGVMQPKGLATNGFDQDDFVMIPYTTAMKKLKGIYWLDDIFASAVSPDAIPPQPVLDYGRARLRLTICRTWDKFRMRGLILC